MKIDDILQKTIDLNASDLHILVGERPVYRIDGTLLHDNAYDVVTKKDAEDFCKDVLNEQQFQTLISVGEVDTSVSSGTGKFRLNAFKQSASFAMAFRYVKNEIPNFRDLGLPVDVMTSLCQLRKGLVLVVGATGSGKSTTMASMVNEINTNRNCHIITLEDPIEYTYKNEQSIINQREVGRDTKSYAAGLRAAMRQDPDVILIGEMRDLETIQIALTAAETGHLVLSTLHTINATQSIDRIIDIFPEYQQAQVRTQLSMTLQAVVAQQLVKNKNNSGRHAAVEVLIANSAVRNLIRENKIYSIDNIIDTSSKFGMISMDKSLANLYNNNLISYDEMVSNAINKDEIVRKIR